MLERVWMVAPGARGKRFALQGDWLQLPLEAQSFGVVLGDGSFSMIGRGMGAALAARIRSVLRREGRFSLRAYVRPAAGETPEEVRDALVSGRIGGFQGFKLRLLMALANEVGEVPVRTAWEWFCRECPAPEAISRRLGWSLEVIETIGAYRGQSAVYWFPTLEEIREVFCADFTELSCRWPGYELGDRCPTLVLQPRV
jgi:SAM-dependent methyltransferase